MYFSFASGTAQVVAGYEDADSGEPDVELDEWRTGWSSLGAAPDTRREQLAALRELAEKLGAYLSLVEGPLATEVTIHLAPDTDRMDVRGWAERLLSPLGIDPAALLARLDGGERQRDWLERRGGEVVETRLQFSLPNEGIALSQRGEYREATARDKQREQTQLEREREHREAILRDRAQREADLAARLGQREELASVQAELDAARAKAADLETRLREREEATERAERDAIRREGMRVRELARSEASARREAERWIARDAHGHFAGPPERLPERDTRGRFKPAEGVESWKEHERSEARARRAAETWTQRDASGRFVSGPATMPARDASGRFTRKR